MWPSFTMSSLFDFSTWTAPVSLPEEQVLSPGPPGQPAVLYILLLSLLNTPD